MSADARKEMKKMVKDLISEGWFLEHGSKHDKVYTPTRSHYLTISKTPSDKYAAAQFGRDVKRLKIQLNME